MIAVVVLVGISFAVGHVTTRSTPAVTRAVTTVGASGVTCQAGHLRGPC